MIGLTDEGDKGNYRWITGEPYLYSYWSLGTPNNIGGQWYSNAIVWASEQKIVSGYTDGRYGINDNITREQVAKMLYEYAKSNGNDVSMGNELGSFTDSSIVSDWAVVYMKWATAAGMITGKPNGNGSFRLDPKGQATRAECAKMITMFMKMYGE